MDSKKIKQHWENIYAEKKPEEVSWFQAEPIISLKLIQKIGHQNAQIIDVGGGASTLVDHLLKLGYANIAVLDISNTAIEYDKKRLLGSANKIEWIVDDVTQFKPLHSFDIWHDRAVFHFLVKKSDRESYVNTLKDTIKSGGHVILATFAKEGPKKCIGLDIVQYDTPSIQHEFGDEFILLESQTEMHVTPKGNEQKFVYFLFKRK